MLLRKAKTELLQGLVTLSDSSKKLPMFAGDNSMLLEIQKILLTANGVAIQQRYAMLMEVIRFTLGVAKALSYLSNRDRASDAHSLVNALCH